MRIVLLIILAINFTACAIYQPADTDYRPADLPSQFSMYSEQADLAGQWWKDFDSPELDWLVDKALSGNFSVSEAWARLEQSRYAARIVGADKYPELSYQAGGAVWEGSAGSFSEKGCLFRSRCGRCLYSCYCRGGIYFSLMFPKHCFRFEAPP